MSQERPARKNTLPLHGFITLVALAAQMLLGIAAALFQELPKDADRWAASSVGWSGAHMILGSLVVVLAVWVVVLSFLNRASTWKVASILGLVGVLAAYGFGTAFVQADNDAYTFLMSVGLAVAFLAYAFGLWRGERPTA